MSHIDEAPGLSGPGASGDIVTAAKRNISPSSAPTTNCKRRLGDLEVIAAWRQALAHKLAVAELCFNTIGISGERVRELEHEVHCFTRVCRLVVREVER
jgi:hypothetical protein